MTICSCIACPPGQIGVTTTSPSKVSFEHPQFLTSRIEENVNLKEACLELFPSCGF
jgi:hypothetical protein